MGWQGQIARLCLRLLLEPNGADLEELLAVIPLEMAPPSQKCHPLGTQDVETRRICQTGHNPIPSGDERLLMYAASTGRQDTVPQLQAPHLLNG